MDREGTITMLRITRPVAIVALGCALALSASPAAFAQQAGADEREVAVGSDLGNIAIDAADIAPAPDSPTTVAVGGDSNETVPQPDLSGVPSSGGDGIFSAPTGLASPLPAAAPATLVQAPATAATPAEPIPAEAAPAEAAPAEAAPAEAAPAEAAPAETAPAEPATAPAEPTSAPAPGPACGYPTWYDAQLALEADASLASTLDPDNDGIACEEAMT